MRGRSSVWLERQPVTLEVAGSSPVGPAMWPLLSSILTRAFFFHILFGNQFPANDIGAGMRPRDVTFETYEFGEDLTYAPLENDSPEERFYNRTVIIDIVP
jgi:hypothetical protein